MSTPFEKRFSEDEIRTGLMRWMGTTEEDHPVIDDIIYLIHNPVRPPRPRSYFSIWAENNRLRKKLEEDDA